MGAQGTLTDDAFDPKRNYAGWVCAITFKQQTPLEDQKVYVCYQNKSRLAIWLDGKEFWFGSDSITSIKRLYTDHG